MRLSNNFSKSEFDSKDGSDMTDLVMSNIQELVANLQVLRDELNAVITITSGYRSKAHTKRLINKGVKTSLNSKHVLGQAADLKVSGFTPKQVAEKIEELILKGKMKQGGIGIYSSWVHYDIRGSKARW